MIGRKSLGMCGFSACQSLEQKLVRGGIIRIRFGKAGAAACFWVLFDFEPTTAVHAVLDYLIVGRYNIF
jgi:hypothetical protein